MTSDCNTNTAGSLQFAGVWWKGLIQLCLLEYVIMLNVSGNVNLITSIGNSSSLWTCYSGSVKMDI